MNNPVADLNPDVTEIVVPITVAPSNAAASTAALSDVVYSVTVVRSLSAVQLSNTLCTTRFPSGSNGAATATATSCRVVPADVPTVGAALAVGLSLGGFALVAVLAISFRRWRSRRPSAYKKLVDNEKGAAAGAPLRALTAAGETTTRDPDNMDTPPVPSLPRLSTNVGSGMRRHGIESRAASPCAHISPSVSSLQILGTNPFSDFSESFTPYRSSPSQATLVPPRPTVGEVHSLVGSIHSAGSTASQLPSPVSAPSLVNSESPPYSSSSRAPSPLSIAANAVTRASAPPATASSSHWSQSTQPTSFQAYSPSVSDRVFSPSGRPVLERASTADSALRTTSRPTTPLKPDRSTFKEAHPATSFGLPPHFPPQARVPKPLPWALAAQQRPYADIPRRPVPTQLPREAPTEGPRGDRRRHTRSRSEIRPPSAEVVQNREAAEKGRSSVRIPPVNMRGASPSNIRDALTRGRDAEVGPHVGRVVGPATLVEQRMRDGKKRAMSTVGLDSRSGRVVV